METAPPLLNEIGGRMASTKLRSLWRLAALIFVAALPAAAQSFRVQCPTSTITHPDPGKTGVNNAEPTYTGATTFTAGAQGYMTPSTHVNGAIKCQQISGGDGYATTADGGGLFGYNGAIGQVPDMDNGGAIDGHVDPRQIMDIGVMNGNIPAPLMAIDEDDEFFLTLSNVGMIMRPDLFEQHTVHFHGYPNASAFYDGVPDASVAINIGASFTYYYLAPDAGTYFWHCHITPPEHLQMGMVGQLYVRPRQ